MKKEIKKELEFLKLEHPTAKLPKTLGQRAADKLTSFAGSWTFIFLLFIFIIIWMTVNASWLIFGKSWDPYPFILLNFILSCLAAIQAPIILMSQNREAQRDRLRAQYDYHINKKAEKEIQQLLKEIQSIKKYLSKKPKK